MVFDNMLEAADITSLVNFSLIKKYLEQKKIKK